MPLRHSTIARPATEAQLKKLRALAFEREMRQLDRCRLVATVDQQVELNDYCVTSSIAISRERASELIRSLAATPYAAQKLPGIESDAPALPLQMDLIA